MEVLVVGAGSMGRWFADTVGTDVTFVDVDSEAAREAADRVGGRAVDPEQVSGIEDRADADDPLGRFDVVCIAVPMSAAEDAIAQWAGRAENALVDVTGEMSSALTAMESHAPETERASFHPLFAPDRAPGNVAVVEGQGGPTVRAILDTLEAAGNDLVETTASEHDAAMGTIQSAAHAAVLAYGIAAEEVPDGFETPVSAALDDLVERVGGGNPDVYAEIQATFSGAQRVADAAAEIASADTETFRELYAAAEPSRRTERTDHGEPSTDNTVERD